MIRILLTNTALIIAFTQSAVAQRETVNQSAEWFAITSNIKLDKRFSVLAEGQFRFVNNLDPMQFQARTGLDVAVSKHFSFMPVAYVYSWNPIYGKQPATYSNNEHRIFQQLQYTHRIGRFFVGHRARLEQRFIQVHDNVNGEVVNKGYTLYLNRLRYRLQVQVPINNKEMVPGTFYASFYNELFLDFGSNVVYTDPDQNRFFAGAGYKINKKASFQLGYLYQMLIKLSGTKQENNIGFQAQIIYNIDLSKKEN
jgi:predicted porin